jgi:hypothetical protein
MGRDTSSYSARRGSRGLSDLDDKICPTILDEILLNLVEPDFALNPGLIQSNQHSAIDPVLGVVREKVESRISGWELSEK